MSAAVTGRILLLATGGTIASDVGTGRRKVYRRDAAAIEPLLRVARATGAAVHGEQIATIGSQDIGPAVWQALHARIVQCFAADEADGVVVTHGTDTMEETAFFLDLICPPGRPIVLAGAMRSANRPDSDGPANLAAACRVAADGAARGRGVLVTMDGVVHAARAVRKAATEGIDAFTSHPAAPLGRVEAAGVVFSAPPVAPRLAGRFTAQGCEGLPPVAVLAGHAAIDPTMLRALIAAPLAGIVAAGVGEGNLPSNAIEALAAARRSGMAVVRATRIDGGHVGRGGEVDDDALGFVAARDLGPSKARLLLQLLLAAGERDPVRLQQAFD